MSFLCVPIDTTFRLIMQKRSGIKIFLKKFSFSVCIIIPVYTYWYDFQINFM